MTAALKLPKGFDAADVAVLTVTQVPGLTSTQIAALSTSPLGGLSRTQIAALTTVQVPGLTATDVRDGSDSRVNNSSSFWSLFDVHRSCPSSRATSKSERAVRYYLFVFVLIFLIIPEVTVAAEGPNSAKVIDVSGQVEVNLATDAGWKTSPVGQILHAGDTIRTGYHSRVSLLLVDESLI